MFTEKFSSYACEGDTITCRVKGFDITARIVRDENSGEPWKNCDWHGPVSEWTYRAKSAGELVLASNKGSFLYYDFQEAVKIAKRDGWGPGAPHEAARKDFEFLRGWCDDEWFYCGIILSVSRNDVELEEHAASLWGIECNAGENNNYLSDVANELLAEAIEVAESVRAKVCA